MNDAPPTIEERITARTDLSIAGGTEVSSTVGGLAFKDMGQVLEFSKLMAVSRQAVPKHLRAEPGACMAITLQALNWRMDPFAVANKSYMVNDRIAYEAQLIHAVVEQRAPIKGRIKGKVVGKDSTRQWLLSVETKDGDVIEYEGPEIGKITTKNSPLWKADPDQQLWYYSVRAMCRRHFPDVILGVYEKEEIEQSDGMRDVTPATGGFAAKAAAAKAAENSHSKLPGGEKSVADVIAEGERAHYAAEATKAATTDHIPDAETVTPHWTDNIVWEDAFPGSKEWDEGVAAYGTLALTECPHEDSPGKASDWIGGWHSARKAAQ